MDTAPGGTGYLLTIKKALKIWITSQLGSCKIVNRWRTSDHQGSRPGAQSSSKQQEQWQCFRLTWTFTLMTFLIMMWSCLRLTVFYECSVLLKPSQSALACKKSYRHNPLNERWLTHKPIGFIAFFWYFLLFLSAAQPVHYQVTSVEPWPAPARTRWNVY